MSIVPSLFGALRTGGPLDPFALDVWDPLKDSSSSLSNFFPDFSGEVSGLVNDQVDYKETREAQVFKANIPGLKEEEVKVDVEDDRVLQISGDGNVEEEEKNDTWDLVERGGGKFMRRFRLPENA